ncbi:MAG TPA: redoxin domain-containing protein [Thermoleophilaceae bacterium]
MPDDRFADLGPPREGPSAAERFEDLDRTSPEPDAPKPPDPVRASGRYTWVVGVAFLIVVIIGGINALNNEGGGYQGIRAGRALPVFAAPLTTSDHDNDASVQPRAGGGHPGACDVRLAGVVTLCDLRRRPLVITFVANAGNSCRTQLDRVERVRSSFPGVNFLGVISRKSLSEARDIVQENGWTLPVALDRDAALFNLYSIGDCPTTVFARKGGRSAGSRRGFLTDAQLRAAIRALVRKAPR